MPLLHRLATASLLTALARCTSGASAFDKINIPMPDAPVLATVPGRGLGARRSLAERPARRVRDGARVFAPHVRPYTPEHKGKVESAVKYSPACMRSCSLEPEEGPLLVRAVAEANGLTIELEQTWTPEHHATDGFYLVRLRPR